MANMFAQIAKRATTLSVIMENREKITTEDIINNYPDGITITEFDMVTTPDANGNPNTYPVIAFKEDNSKFIYGGKALNDMVTLWLANFDGDVEATSSALKAAGGVKIKMIPAKTKQGRNFTKIDVIGMKSGAHNVGALIWFGGNMNKVVKSYLVTLACFVLSIFLIIYGYSYSISYLFMMGSMIFLPLSYFLYYAYKEEYHVYYGQHFK